MSDGSVVRGDGEGVGVAHVGRAEAERERERGAALARPDAHARALEQRRAGAVGGGLDGEQHRRELLRSDADRNRGADVDEDLRHRPRPRASRRGERENKAGQRQRQAGEDPRALDALCLHGDRGAHGEMLWKPGLTFPSVGATWPGL